MYDSSIPIMRVLPVLLGQCVPLVEGPPGCGKTSAVRALAARLGRRSFTVCPSHKLDTEIHGQPVISKKTFPHGDQELTVVETAPPKYIMEAVAAPEGAIINYDEFNTCDSPRQATMLSVLEDRVCGDIDLPRSMIALIACCNPTNMSAGGMPLTPPAANRLVHMKYRFDPVDFATNLGPYWGNPPPLGVWNMPMPEEEWLQDRSMVSAYLRAFPGEVMSIPDDEAQLTGAYATGRTWDKATRMMTACRLLEVPDVDRLELINGCVGEGKTKMFLAWQATRNWPDPRELLDHPASYKVPKDDAAATFYILTGCASEAARRKRLSLNPPAGTGPNEKARLAKAASHARMVVGKLLGMTLDKKGPRDVVAVVGRMLLDPAVWDAKEPIFDEVTRIAPVVKAAGLDWTRKKA